jgi:hypothetical protein
MKSFRQFIIEIELVKNQIAESDYSTYMHDSGNMNKNQVLELLKKGYILYRGMYGYVRLISPDFKFKYDTRRNIPQSLEKSSLITRSEEKLAALKKIMPDELLTDAWVLSELGKL